ncbi:MAG TPA: hypothetical protein VD862_00805 [Candidatus Paceibacterota bacterium]|nr:hypothetical protein [Candidatus Paceibacterota bacterium]
MDDSVPGAPSGDVSGGFRSRARARRKARLRRMYRRHRFWWVVWGIIAVGLLPFTEVGVARALMPPGERSFADYCRASPYCQLWFDHFGGERERLSMPLGEREQGIWDGVVAKARAKGLQFIEPQVRQTTPEGDAVPVFRFDREVLGVAYGGNRILLSSRHLSRMDDGLVAVLMAHELGHRIDNQTERVGHDAFGEIRYSGSQEFADAIAAYICGQDELARFHQWKWDLTVRWSWEQVFDEF